MTDPHVTAENTGYQKCPTCGDTQYDDIETEPDYEDDVDVVACSSCKTPLRLNWLDEASWEER